MTDSVAADLTGIWATLLGLDPAEVSDEDTFFDLGGHSLLGIEMLRTVNARYGIDLPIDALFDDGSLRALARWVRDAVPGGATA